MPANEFLNAPAHSHAKEELFNYRLLYDMKLAAADRGYHLLTYYSDVDHDGFDIIFDDRDTLKKVQLKTVRRGAATNSWDIHKHLLRPTLRNWEVFGYDFVASPGVEGGVVLMEYEVGAQSTAVDYYYTDLYVITMSALEFRNVHYATRDAAQGIYTAVGQGGSNETVAVSRGCFVRAASPQHLLALIGLHSEHLNNWRGLARLAIGEHYEPGSMGDLPAPADHLQHSCAADLATAVGYPLPQQ